MKAVNYFYKKLHLRWLAGSNYDSGFSYFVRGLMVPNHKTCNNKEMLQEYDLLLCIFHVPKSQNMQQLRNATRIWFTTVYISCFWWYFLLSSNHSGHQVRLAAVKPNLIFHNNYFTSDCCLMLGTRNKGLMLQTNTHYLCCGSHCHRLVLFSFCLELASAFDPQITVFALVFLLLILSYAFWSDFFLSFLINSFSRSIYIITWKISKYGVFSGPYFPVFRMNTERFTE